MMIPANPKRSYVYGPVPSRRLGRSLGVDLVPLKTCTYDCVYCQLGNTTDKVIERRECAPLDEVLAELEPALAHGTDPDYISLAGSGEPTLHMGIGRLLAAIKEITDVPVAVITNGSLLWDEEVQNDLLLADLVLPSLDAGDARMFSIVNRPHEALSFESVVEGLKAFTRRFTGEVWLEVMLLTGLTDEPAEAQKIAALAEAIAPARTQLNTATRPAAEYFAGPVPAKRLTTLSTLFGGQVDVISDFVGEKKAQVVRDGTADKNMEDKILALLERRPCTAEDIASGLGLHVLDVLKRLEGLLDRQRIVVAKAQGRSFYVPVGPRGQSQA